jgi:hypothetical protein
VHVHVWKPFVAEGVGSYSKRDCPGSLSFYQGEVKKCECGSLQFSPKGKGLSPVECTEEHDRREKCVDCEHHVRWHSTEGCMLPACPCRKEGRSFYLVSER